MIPFLAKRRTPSTLLGLTLNGSRLEGVVLRRTNGSLQVQQTLSVALTLNPLNGDPELVGREIRNHLEQAGIRQRRCIVCVPLSWVLTLPIKMPRPAPATTSSGKCAPRYIRDRQTAAASAQGRTFHQPFR